MDPPIRKSTDSWVFIGRTAESIKSEEELNQNANALKDAFCKLGIWKDGIDKEVAEILQNNVISAAFKEFMDQSSALRDAVTQQDPFDRGGLDQLISAKGLLITDIQNQFPSLNPDHFIFHALELLSLHPKGISLALAKQCPIFPLTMTPEEKWLDFNGCTKVSLNQPYWTKVTSKLPKEGSIKITAAIPKGQFAEISIDIPNDELSTIKDMQEDIFENILSHVFAGNLQDLKLPDLDPKQNEEAIRLSRKIKDRFDDLLPKLTNSILNGGDRSLNLENKKALKNMVRSNFSDVAKEAKAHIGIDLPSFETILKGKKEYGHLSHLFSCSLAAKTVYNKFDQDKGFTAQNKDIQEMLLQCQLLESYLVENKPYHLDKELELLRSWQNDLMTHLPKVSEEDLLQIKVARFFGPSRLSPTLLKSVTENSSIREYFWKFIGEADWLEKQTEECIRLHQFNEISRIDIKKLKVQNKQLKYHSEEFIETADLIYELVLSRFQIKMKFYKLMQIIQSIHPISDINIQILEDIYIENKPTDMMRFTPLTLHDSFFGPRINTKPVPFREMFEGCLYFIEECQNKILTSLVETGTLPKNYQDLKAKFEEKIVSLSGFFYSQCESKLIMKSQGENSDSFNKEFRGICEEVVTGNVQLLTDSFSFNGLDPKTYQKIYGDFGGTGKRMIEQARYDRKQAYMKKGIGPILAERYYSSMGGSSHGYLLFKTGLWESSVASCAQPYFVNGICHLGMAKYSQEKDEWVCAREIEIPLDISFLPIDNREKVDVFFKLLEEVLGGKKDPWLMLNDNLRLEEQDLRLLEETLLLSNMEGLEEDLILKKITKFHQRIADVLKSAPNKKKQLEIMLQFGLFSEKESNALKKMIESDNSHLIQEVDPLFQKISDMQSVFLTSFDTAWQENPRSFLAFIKVLNEGKFRKKDVNLIKKIILDFKNEADIALAKVRYAVNFPGTEIPGVKSIS